MFTRLKQTTLEAYDRIADLVMQEIVVDGCITKAPERTSSPAQPGGQRQAEHEAVQHDRRVRPISAGPSRAPRLSSKSPLQAFPRAR